MSKQNSSLVAYIDTSIILRHAVFDQKALQNLEQFSRSAMTSALTRIECFRVLDRWRITGEVDDEKIAQAWKIAREFLSSLKTIPISAPVVTLASQSFPIALKSLDAIHLASAMLIRTKYASSSTSKVYMLTHDTKLALAATAMDLAVLGVD